MKLRFRAFDESVMAEPFISVDGVVCESHPNEIMNLGHWPGNRTPKQLKANTTVEIAQKLLHSQQWRPKLEHAETLTNHHYDTDGVLACWTLIAPDIALAYSDLMVSASVAGDYGFFTTPEGVKLDLLLSNLQHPVRSPIADKLGADPIRNMQLLYDWVLERLPDLFVEIEEDSELWEPEYGRIVADLRLISAGRATIREHTSAVLAVIESDQWLNLVARWSRTQGARLLSIVHRPDGTLFELQYSLHAFHDRVDQPSIFRANLSPVAEHFNGIETSLEGHWAFKENRFIPKISYIDVHDNLVPSHLDATEVEEYLVAYFTQFGDKWIYHRESPWGRVVEGTIVPVVPWSHEA